MEKGLDRVLARRHPDGLEAGRNENAWREMKDPVPKAQFTGAEIMDNQNEDKLVEQSIA